MRLVDTDVIEKELGVEDRDLYVQHILDSAPTVEAEPIKHGHWINNNGLYQCSLCKEYTVMGWASCISIEYMNKTMKYCNNCGAKMDGGEE